MSWLNPPASMMFVTDVSATRRRESESSVSISFRCWGVSPSGPPDEPGGNDRSSCRIVEVFTVMDESEAAGSGGLGVRLSADLVGCFSCSFAIVSASIGAGVSSEQIRRTAALKFPSSSLLVTAAASNSSLSFFLLLLPCRRSVSGSSILSFHLISLALMTLVKFLFAPRLRAFLEVVGQTRTLSPKHLCRPVWL